MSNTPSSSAQDHLAPGVADATPELKKTQKLPNRRPMKKQAKAAPAKAPGAFRTISEVATELNVEQHVLRFWETKFSYIKPVKRGGGRRYYRPEDIELLKNIHNLLYVEGYTIKGVQKLLSAHRGNLGDRAAAAPRQPAAAAAPKTAEVAAPAAASSQLARNVNKHRTELQDMLSDLKSMRRMIGDA